MKNLTEFKGYWNETKGKLKRKFASLTYNESLFIDGKIDETMGKAQIDLGKRKAIHRLISELE